MAPNQPFEMPKQVRELAEKNVERAHASYAQFMDIMTQALNVWSAAPSNAFGFRGIQELAIRLAKENTEDAFALARDLANAKDIQGLLSLQTYYAQTQAQSCASQAQELGHLMGDAMQSLKSSLESKSLGEPEFDY